MSTDITHNDKYFGKSTELFNYTFSPPAIFFPINPIYICYHEMIKWIRYAIPALSTYVTMSKPNRSDIQYRTYIHILPWEDSVHQIYNTDPIYICYHEKTQSIRYIIPTYLHVLPKKRLSRSDIHYRSYPQMLPMRRLSRSDIKHRSCLQILPTRRLNQSNIQYRPYLHMLPWEESVDQIYNTDPIHRCYPWKD